MHFHHYHYKKHFCSPWSGSVMNMLSSRMDIPCPILSTETRLFCIDFRQRLYESTFPFHKWEFVMNLLFNRKDKNGLIRKCFKDPTVNMLKGNLTTMSIFWKLLKVKLSMLKITKSIFWEYIEFFKTCNWLTNMGFC